MATKAVQILLIEDDAVETQLVMAIFAKQNQSSFRLQTVDNLKSGFDRLSNQDIDVVLLDLNLPDGGGVETFYKVQMYAPNVPVVVRTTIDDEDTALEALRNGAQDYLVKNELDPKTLHRSIRYAIERKKIERQLKKANDDLARDEKVLVDMLASLKKSNEDLKETQLQLIQSEKLEVVGRLAAGVAHEVKNPLAMLRMGVDYFVKRKHADDKRALFMLESMAEAIKRADMVIKEMLDFSSLKALQMRSEDLNSVVERSLVLVKHELEQYQITLIKKFGKDIPRVQLDRNRIEQVLINLITNGVQAMGKGGELTIAISTEKLKEVGGFVGYRKDDVFLPGDSVAVIYIEDTGSGIPEEFVDKVFDPFFTTKRSKGGTGLGLSVVKNIIQLHRGTIQVENMQEGGARFTLMLKLE